jgi:glycosyltransferase involved in cell wall biosynthesis
MIDELSIIIPTLNEEKFLPKLLQSISEQKYPLKLEVIVVDGNSADGTIQVAKRFQNVLPALSIVKSKRGVSHQRNVGAAQARYKYILFLDADIILPKKFLPRLLRFVKEREYFLIYVLQIPLKFNFLDYLVISPLVVIAFIQQFYEPVLSGSFMFTTKKNHEKIGGFKEGAELGEDIDYCQRSFKAGTKYNYLLYPWVLASPRRLRKEGRLRLLFMWVKGYFYIKKNGPIYDAKKFEYTFGKFDGKE